MTVTSELVVAVSNRPTTMRINRTGLVLGLLLGAIHLLWALLVAAGIAQIVVDFVFRLHFIRPVYVIEPFDPLRAVGLVLLTAACGYCIGASFASLWNPLHR